MLIKLCYFITRLLLIPSKIIMPAKKIAILVLKQIY